MTSPPAQHNPPDNGPGREDADAHPPLGQVEAGPQRHSDDPFLTMAREIADNLPVSCHDQAVAAYAAALRSVDRAAREECARIADEWLGSFGDGPPIEFTPARDYASDAVKDIRDIIRQSIKS